MSDKSEALRLEAETVSGLMVQLSENDIDSDSFAVMSDLGENGTEHECDLPITETALRATAVIGQLLAALEEANKWVAAFSKAAELVEGIDMSKLKELEQHSKENLRTVTVTVGVLKSAVREIEAHVSVNGKGVFTIMTLNALKMAIERAE